MLIEDKVDGFFLTQELSGWELQVEHVVLLVGIDTLNQGVTVLQNLAAPEEVRVGVHGDVVWGLLFLFVLTILINEHFRDDHPSNDGVIGKRRGGVWCKLDCELRVVFDRKTLLLLHL